MVRILFIIITLLLSARADICDRINDKQQIQDFLIQCQIPIHDSSQNRYMISNFIDNCDIINKLKKSNPTHQIGSSCMSFYRKEEIVSKIITPPSATPGDIESIPIKKKDGFVQSVANLVGLSSAYTNWQDQRLISSVKNQFNCGDCWSFSTTATMQSAIKRSTGVEYDLAEQYTLQCTDKFKPTNNPKSTCNGGIADFALNMQVAQGIPLESIYPYVASNYGLLNSVPNSIADCFSTSVKYYMPKQPNGSNPVWKRYDNITSTQIQSLLTKGTLTVLYYVDSAFFNYKSGVYSCPVNSVTAYGLINHAIQLVGMDSNGNYVIKNSWGTSWGNKGFATISSTADCGLSGYVYAVTSEKFYYLSFLMLSAILVLAM